MALFVAANPCLVDLRGLHQMGVDKRARGDLKAAVIKRLAKGDELIELNVS